MGNEVIDMEYKRAITKLKCERDKNNTPSLDIAYAMAIETLEKQIPRKVIEQIRLLGSDKGGKCPSCNKYINNCRHWMYCECGQKIDWSDNK